MLPFVGEGGRQVSGDLFRMRDTAGNVIGVAARVVTAVEPARGTTQSRWLLAVTGRGTLFLGQTDVVALAARRRPVAGQPAYIAAFADAAFWASRPATLGVTATGMPGKVLGGTGSFAGLSGGYAERWELAEVNADDSTRGRIVLSTRLVRQP